MLDTADFLFQTVPIYLRVFLLCFNIEQTTVDRIGLSTEMTFQRKLIVFSLLVSINLCHVNGVKDVKKRQNRTRLSHSGRRETLQTSD